MTPPKSTSRAVLAAAALLLFWLGNRMGGTYQTTNGTVTQKLATALNLQQLLAHPLLISADGFALACGTAAVLLAGLVYLCVKYGQAPSAAAKGVRQRPLGYAAGHCPFCGR